MIHQLKTEIENLRQEIIHHQVYKEIRTIEDLKTFMEFHVFAVWDFMSLLKSLQRNLTCIETPWFPVGDPDTRFLINEIVVGEESDVDENGVRKSHFELYCDAMKQIGADVSIINLFLHELKSKQTLSEAFELAMPPKAAQDFVSFTFDMIQKNESYLLAAIFTFGREDLIPEMFLSIVDEISKQSTDPISKFKYYLERHIEVDGDHHSHLALQMTENLCGTDAQKWENATLYVKESLKKRIQLWDGALDKIIQNR
jgi:hypothetical protein